MTALLESETMDTIEFNKVFDRLMQLLDEYTSEALLNTENPSALAKKLKDEIAECRETLTALFDGL